MHDECLCVEVVWEPSLSLNRYWKVVARVRELDHAKQLCAWLLIHDPTVIAARIRYQGESWQ